MLDGNSLSDRRSPPASEADMENDVDAPELPFLFPDKDSICHEAICSLLVRISMISNNSAMQRSPWCHLQPPPRTTDWTLTPQSLTVKAPQSPKKQTISTPKKKERVAWHIYLLLYLLMETPGRTVLHRHAVQIVRYVLQWTHVAALFSQQWRNLSACSFNEKVDLLSSSNVLLQGSIIWQTKSGQAGKGNAGDQFLFRCPDKWQRQLKLRVVPNTMLRSVRYRHNKF